MLRCADDSIYTGITTDVARRVDEHNSDNKKGAKYTRNRRPVSLVFQQNCVSRSLASKREYELKKLNRREKLRLINSHDRNNNLEPANSQNPMKTQTDNSQASKTP